MKKANRELHNTTSRMSDIQKIEHLTKRCSDLLSEMKRHERESIKNKKKGDQLQKDKDGTRNELNKTTSLKEKLEKLCRELQKENNKLKVGFIVAVWHPGGFADGRRMTRMRTRLSPTRRSGAKTLGMRDTQDCSAAWRITRRKRITPGSRLLTWRWTTC